MYVKSKTVRLMTKLSEKRPDIISGDGRVESVRVAYRDGIIHVEIDGFVSKAGFSHLQNDVDQFRSYLSEEIGEPVVVVLDAIGVDMIKLRSATPAQPDEKN